MNVIKFKDALGPDDQFNDLFRGKYAYWINMKYAVPFDCISESEYIAFERNPKLLTCSAPRIPYVDTDRGCINILIDVEETDVINSIKTLKGKNNLVPSDITVAQLKKFRTWLAKKLLELNEFNEDQHAVINYYAQGMYDGVVKVLSKIDRSLNIPIKGVQGSCNSCSNLSNPFTELSTCDPLETYRTYIYTEMVKMFSEVDFWKDQYSNFLQEMLIYVRGIITSGLSISSTSGNKYKDCSCTTTVGDEYFDILKRLAKSIEYILDSDIVGHRLYIAKALNEWASSCYEQMEWA